MSRYDWERGTIKLPTAVWPTFKKALRTAYNGALAHDFALVLKAFERVKADNKGKRGVDWVKALTAELEATEKGYSYLYGNVTRNRYDLQVLTTWQVAQKLQQKDETTGKVRLVSPQKKMFPEANSKTMSFSLEDEATITLDDKTRSVRWNVSENNRACERAREHHMAVVLFKMLGGVQWTRGSGGAIVGNDENNRDNRDDAGGGANYLKDRFGPLGDDEYERVHGMRPFVRRTGSGTSRTGVRRF